MKASDDTDLTIGDFAARVGVPTHVLRYWEDRGLLHPHRNLSGYRRYGRDELTRVLLIRRNQMAGMSLEQIHALVDSTVSGRRDILRAHLDRLADQEESLRRSRAMTEHALACRAHDVTTCPRFMELVGDLYSNRSPAGRLDGIPGERSARTRVEDP